MIKNELIKLYCTHGYSKLEACSEIDFLFENYFNLDKKSQILGKTLSVQQENEAFSIISKRVTTKMPLAYILGFAFFYNEKFSVTYSTLIPRPETEILVGEVLKEDLKDKKVLDICTGSGCIAIIIAKKSNVKVFASDISKDALEIARKNAQQHNVQIEFINSDLVSNINEKFDYIVSNPPYISTDFRNKLQFEVENFEPANALFTKDEKGIEFYKKIIEGASDYLNKNGKIFFEVGQNQADFVKNLFLQNGFENIRITMDLEDNKRVIIAQN